LESSFFTMRTSTLSCCFAAVDAMKFALLNHTQKFGPCVSGLSSAISSRNMGALVVNLRKAPSLDAISAGEGAHFTCPTAGPTRIDRDGSRIYGTQAFGPRSVEGGGIALANEFLPRCMLSAADENRGRRGALPAQTHGPESPGHFVASCPTMFCEN